MCVNAGNGSSEHDLDESAGILPVRSGPRPRCTGILSHCLNETDSASIKGFPNVAKGCHPERVFDNRTGKE